MRKARSAFGEQELSAGRQDWLCCPGNHLCPSQSMSASKEVRGGHFLLGGFPFCCCWQRGEGSGQGKGREPEQGKTLQEVVCSTLGVEGKKDLSQGRKGKWVAHARAGETVFGLESWAEVLQRWVSPQEGPDLSRQGKRGPHTRWFPLEQGDLRESVVTLG